MLKFKNNIFSYSQNKLVYLKNKTILSTKEIGTKDFFYHLLSDDSLQSVVESSVYCSVMLHCATADRFNKSRVFKAKGFKLFGIISLDFVIKGSDKIKIPKNISSTVFMRLHFHEKSSRNLLMH